MHNTVYLILHTIVICYTLYTLYILYYRDQALQQFHADKIREVNKIIRELWQLIYEGQDIDMVSVCEYIYCICISTQVYGILYMCIVYICGDAGCILHILTACIICLYHTYHIRSRFNPDRRPRPPQPAASVHTTITSSCRKVVSLWTCVDDVQQDKKFLLLSSYA